ncbi:MAG: DUF58 domain-containing protein [Pseudonocardia sp.]|nr:DUF58 domain-containing protein [Pseudonocardia sp.]
MALGLTGLTTQGRCLLAAGVACSACSIALNERDLLRIGTFVLVMPLLAALLATLTRCCLHATRTVIPDRVSVGAEPYAQLKLDNSGWLLGGQIVLTDALPDALGRSPRLTIAASHQSESFTVVRYPITPVIRGRHLIGPLTVRISDPLGLAEYERELAGRTPLMVLPRVTPLNGSPEGFGHGEGSAGATGRRRGPGERDALVRQYQPGDPVRTVHWRSTARRDELMVRLEERPWHGGVTVLIDRRARAHYGNGANASLEWAVELVASICHHLITRGRRIRLVAEDGVTLASGRDTEALLDSLAMLRPSTQPELVLGGDEGDDGQLIAVLGAVDQADVAVLARHHSGGSGRAVLLDVAEWNHAQQKQPAPDVTEPARALTEAGWTVLIGKPGCGPAEIWRDFCQDLPIRQGTGR